MSEESPKPQADELDDICRHGRDLLEEECVPCATLKIRCEAEHWEKEAHEKSEELCAFREQHSQDRQADVNWEKWNENERLEFDEEAFDAVYQPLNRNDEIHAAIEEGARWQWQQDRQAREELRAEIENLKNQYSCYEEYHDGQITALERKAADLAGTVKLYRLDNAELKVKITALEQMNTDKANELKRWVDKVLLLEGDVKAVLSELTSERERAKGLVEALEFYGDHWGTSNTKIISDGYKVADLAINKYRSTEPESP